MTICLTTHARLRLQQRGICVEALAELLEFGTSLPAGGGVEIVFFEKSELQRLQRTRRRHGRDHLRQLYAVTDVTGTVITVGHRYRRIRPSSRLGRLNK
jgi:hypothetical protein